MEVKEKVEYPPKPFFNQVREIRKSVNLTINDMAGKIGIGVVTYMRIEDGADLKLSIAMRIIEIFHEFGQGPFTIADIWSAK